MFYARPSSIVVLAAVLLLGGLAKRTFAAPPPGWVTCGGVLPALNATACPPTATCCHQRWSPGQGSWGCIDNDWGRSGHETVGKRGGGGRSVAQNIGAVPMLADTTNPTAAAGAAAPAVCCNNGFTACPAGYRCEDTGRGADTITTCVPVATVAASRVHNVRSGRANPNPPSPSSPSSSSSSSSWPNGNTTLRGRQVCKQGAPLAPDPKRRNVLIIGDSVSIGYTPYVAAKLAGEAFVQHSPWGGDGGAEESAYGLQCLDYLLRAPDGTPLRPDVLMFNWGLHSRFPAGSTPIIPGQHGDPRVYRENLLAIAEKLLSWSKLQQQPEVKLLFAVTSPYLDNATINGVIKGLNEQAVEIMRAKRIPTVSLYDAITGWCGQPPQRDGCWGQRNCWSPHCPCSTSGHSNNSAVCGYGKLANSTIAPAIQRLLVGL